ncbi:recombinase family protein [Mesorhizobium muleiense]|uniref:recombinase family protein n=1 Tax=Mesorhizobium muleiense TaxID=1004279 RepID=UPI0039B09F25
MLAVTVGRSSPPSSIFSGREDELLVTRLDRLGRDTRDVLIFIHECERREAFVTVLDRIFRPATWAIAPPATTSSPPTSYLRWHWLQISFWL